MLLLKARIEYLACICGEKVVMKLNSRVRQTLLTVMNALNRCRWDYPSMPALFSSSLSMRTESPGISCLFEFPLHDSSYLKMFHFIQSQLTNYHEQNTSRNKSLRQKMSSSLTLWELRGVGIKEKVRDHMNDCCILNDLPAISNWILNWKHTN